MSDLMRYTVLAAHPSTGVLLDVELIATSERFAISRTRGTLFHRDRDVRWLQGVFTVIDVQPFERQAEATPATESTEGEGRS